MFLWVVKLISLEGKDIVKKPHSCHNSNLNGLLKGQQLKVFTSRAFLQKMSHYSFKALTTRDAIWFIPQSNLGGLFLTELLYDLIFCEAQTLMVQSHTTIPFWSKMPSSCHHLSKFHHITLRPL